VALFLLPIFILMGAHSWLNSVIHLPPKSTVTYRSLYEVIQTAKFDFGLTKQALDNNILYVEYNNSKPKFRSPTVNETAGSYIISKINEQKSAANYNACLAVIKTNNLTKNAAENPLITPKLFKNYLYSSLGADTRSIMENFSIDDVDWVKEKGDYYYVGYHFPNGNCLNSLNSSYSLTPSELIASEYINKIPLNTAMEIEKNGQSHQFVGNINALNHWMPITFLIELSASNNSVQTQFHSNLIRGENGIVYFNLKNPKLIFSPKNGGASIELPIIEGELGNIDTSGRKIMVFHLGEALRLMFRRESIVLNWPLTICFLELVVNPLFARQFIN
jgi:hypothetical protein